MNHLHFDCFNGISGDMMLAALVDAGASTEQLEDQLKRLQLNEPFQLRWEHCKQQGLSALRLHVEGEASHSHRSFASITSLIEESGLTEGVKKRALAIFTLIAQAEAKIHQTTPERVHFHEVGALDSIIDIVGVAIALESLQVTSFSSSPLPVGQGSIHIQHGEYPLPAPATMEILKGIPLQPSQLEGELTTPTGAAILAALVQQFGPIPSMVVERIGYGMGKRRFPERPNLLRLFIGRRYTPYTPHFRSTSP